MRANSHKTRCAGRFAQVDSCEARVERIREAADSNKAQIYHYFGGKAQLFEAVYEQALADLDDRGTRRPVLARDHPA